MKSQHHFRRKLTPIAIILVTIYHFLLIPIADQLAIVWLELPVLVILAILAYKRHISLTLPLCYATVCMFHLAEPAVGFSYISWFLILPFFFILEREEKLGVLLFYGLWTGVLIATGIYSWLWRGMIIFFEFNPAIAFFLLLLIAFFIGIQPAIFLSLTRFLYNRLRWSLALIVPGLYTVIEYWMPIPLTIALSAGMLNHPFFLQPADLLGMHGVSLLVAIVTATVFAILKAVKSKNKVYLLIAVSIMILTLTFHLVYSYWCLTRFTDDPTAPAVDIAMIQPVAPLKVKNTDVKLQEEVAGELQRLSLIAINQQKRHPDLLIWPEGAGPFASRTPEFNPPYMRAVVNIQKATPVTLLVQDIEFSRDLQTNKVRYYSSVSLIEPVGKTIASYHKNILMPFSEYLPLEDKFPFLRQLLPQARSILPGKSAVSLSAPGGRIVPLICYEVLFPNYVRHFVRQGCDYIVNLTNDRWYGRRQQPHQHLAITILRAIENRKPIVRVTNSGISAFIDARGIIAPDKRTK
ncbi:MAG: apolipoprotein N-acyltransferase, partial [Candidatus Sumerlaeia bacterium]|nr:apolipoprotein N-acyltransferase [Candidatus Sumerlaeia bacterium]